MFQIKHSGGGRRFEGASNGVSDERDKQKLNGFVRQWEMEEMEKTTDRHGLVQFQKISILPPRKVFCFTTPVPPGNSSLASYFPLEFPMTFHGVGMDFFWNCILWNPLFNQKCEKRGRGD